MPSSRSRRSASTSRPSRIRSPALSWTTRSISESHSGVAYSGWLPTSRYSLAPFRKKTLLLRPQETTRRNRYRATSSGESRRWPRNVHVTPYSFSRPKILLSIDDPLSREARVQGAGQSRVRKHAGMRRSLQAGPTWQDQFEAARADMGRIERARFGDPQGVRMTVAELLRDHYLP